MGRWPVLLGFSVAMASTTVACGSQPPAVVPCLSNAPNLGGTGPTDDRVHDVVANGRDSQVDHVPA